MMTVFRAPVLSCGLALCALLTQTAAGAAEPLTFTICTGAGDGVSFRQPKGSDELIISCTNPQRIVITVKGCVGPHVKRQGTGSQAAYSFTCDRMNHYDLVPHP
jgi:hypothetical protein